MSMKTLIVLGAFVVSGIGISGCNKAPTNNVGDPQATTKVDTHEGWWCSEHGVPEEQCAQCNAKLAEEYKAKGDWCKEHDRPESQCFICHPEYKAKFAALYEAKYGKKPPEPGT